jgi:hypothetical protein
MSSVISVATWSFDLSEARSKSNAIDNPNKTHLGGAVGATEDRSLFFNAMADDSASAVSAAGG